MLTSKLIEEAEANKKYWEKLAYDLRKLELDTQLAEDQIYSAIARCQMIASDEVPSLIIRLIAAIGNPFGPDIPGEGEIVQLLRKLLAAISTDAADRGQPPDNEKTDSQSATSLYNTAQKLRHSGLESQGDEDQTAQPPKSEPSDEGLTDLAAIDEINCVSAPDLQNSVNTEAISDEIPAQEEVEAIADAVAEEGLTDGEPVEGAVATSSSSAIETPKTITPPDGQQSLFPLLAASNTATPQESKPDEEKVPEEAVPVAEIRFVIDDWKVEVEPSISQGNPDGYNFFFFKDNKNEGFLKKLTAEQMGDRPIEECAREQAQRILEEREEAQEEIPYVVPANCAFNIGDWKVKVTQKTDKNGQFDGLYFYFSDTKMVFPAFEETLNVQQIDKRSPRACGEQILADREIALKAAELPSPDADGFIEVSSAVRFRVQEDSTIEGRLAFSNRTSEGKKTSTTASNRAKKWAENLSRGLGLRCKIDDSDHKDFAYDIRITGCSVAQLRALADKDFSELPPEPEYFRQKYSQLKDAEPIAEAAQLG
jgi:hypothetical protein